MHLGLLEVFVVNLGKYMVHIFPTRCRFLVRPYIKSASVP